ncbi:MAG: Holliday junction branch migration protein RuvA [Moraxellaceae bacterium]|nr:MAG: Holliday junction branch migration protein RuvA [Moraxellaceae bacterium]
MIGRINGVLIEKQPPEMLVDVNGVGYEITAPMTTFYQLPTLGNPVTLFTHLTIRDDAHLLYGFYDKQERSLFRTLIKVNGVGPKMALGILSGIEADEFVRCVESNDTATLVKIPGVGKKTAERLIIEMRDKLKQLAIAPALAAQNQGEASDSQSGSLHSERNVISDAESALISLGYKPAEASKAISGLDVSGLASEEVIRMALKGMVKSK